MRFAVLALLFACADPDDRSAAWSYVHATVIRPGCTTAMCHSKLGAAGGVDLSSPSTAYVFLVGRGCDVPPGEPGFPDGNFVAPGRPEASRLMYLLRGEGGSIMPPDSPLPDAEIGLVENWILEGARCN